MNIFKKATAILLLIVTLVSLVGCMPPEETTTATKRKPTKATKSTASTAEGSPTAPSAATTSPSTAKPSATTGGSNTQVPKNGYVVAIDAGHQAKANSGKEPVGPGATEMKTKVSAGTTGVSTGLEEYKLTLMVALKLQKELESRGYTVVMIRTTNDVDISNAERAKIANEAKADAFIRIHADGYNDPSVHGATAICQSNKNPYNKSLYTQSKLLCDKVLKGLVAATGCKERPLQESDTMSGINWCQVPVTILEIGFLTNPEEDQKLSTDAYQNKVATGIANGLDNYFSSK